MSEAGVGHNSEISEAGQGRLRSIVDRIENLEADKAEIMADLKEVFAEAKADGYSIPILRRVVKLRKMDPGKRQEEESLIELYEAALGGK